MIKDNEIKHISKRIKMLKSTLEKTEKPQIKDEISLLINAYFSVLNDFEKSVLGFCYQCDCTVEVNDKGFCKQCGDEVK